MESGERGYYNLRGHSYPIAYIIHSETTFMEKWRSSLHQKSPSATYIPIHRLRHNFPHSPLPLTVINQTSITMTPPLRSVLNITKAEVPFPSISPSSSNINAHEQIQIPPREYKIVVSGAGGLYWICNSTLRDLLHNRFVVVQAWANPR